MTIGEKRIPFAYELDDDTDDELDEDDDFDEDDDVDGDDDEEEDDDEEPETWQVGGIAHSR
jgi:hypothetical protein